MRAHNCTAVLLAASLVACAGDRNLAPLDVAPFVAIGSDGDGAMASWPRISPRHPDGFRVAVPQPGSVRSAPLIYSDSGAFLGPLEVPAGAESESRQPLFARIGPGDSIWVFDESRSVLVYGPDRKYARSAALPVTPWDARVLPGGRMVVTPATFGQPFPVYLLDADGGTIAAIGDSTDIGGAPSPRRLTLGPDGAIWTIAMSHRWRLERWEADGGRSRTLTAAPDWFVPYDTFATPTRQIPPSASVQDAWFDGQGRLWILGKVADRRWAEGIGDSAAGAGTIVDQDRAYDTVFEVVDPESGHRLVHSRLDLAYPFAVEPGVVMRVVTTDGGWYRAELARVLERDR